MDPNSNIPLSHLGRQLNTNRYYKVGELLLLFLIVYVFIKLVLPIAGDDPITKQLLVWVANILMLIYVWAGIKLRGDSWKDFGLTFKAVSFKQGFKIFLLSLLVFVLAMAGFIIGSIIMANITGIPEGANFSGYDFLRDNLPMLMLTLIGVYIVSSFGEEVIYRAFLINRLSEIGNNKRMAVVLAVVLSSVIFGLIHFDWGPMGIVQTGFMGLVLGICYIRLKKRLWILILAHAYMDTILMVQMYMASNV